MTARVWFAEEVFVMHYTVCSVIRSLWLPCLQAMGHTMATTAGKGIVVHGSSGEGALMTPLALVVEAGTTNMLIRRRRILKAVWSAVGHL